MPKAMEVALKAEAKKKGFGKKRTNTYVYGAMRKAGWKPAREIKADAVSSVKGKLRKIYG